ncbi:Crossover junction endonuclease EME1 [Merluccius polli]|uniref:Crossover junction endonuclease EME1 n=1 Tax=Merluccius polli TaxID=89951 RepID=A0AA47MYM6_MERPO|nr:Crossover junction endonuclease EME1 [Merluccius polli]
MASQDDDDVMSLSSDSEGDAPYVSLALRLKQRWGPAAGAAATNQQQRPPVRTAVAGGGVRRVRSPRRTPGRGRRGCPSRPAGQRRRRRRGGAAARSNRGDKENRKLGLERQRAERKAQLEAAKALRPEECLKHMVAVVDPGLLQVEGGGALLTSLQQLGCSCAIEKQPFPRSVSWRRRAPPGQLGEEAGVPDAHVVVQMAAEDFITLVHNYTQVQRHGRTGLGPTLSCWVQELQTQNPGRIVSLAVVDLDKHYKSQKSRGQKTLREAVLGEERAGAKRSRKPQAEPSPDVSRVDVEEAVVHLQLHTSVQVRFLATWKDFSDHITMTTKAIAEAPFKRERDKTGFSFCLESEWAGGQKVDRAGKGLLQVWKRQIQQLNRVSPDMASAILAAFPSPQLLQQAYQRCRTDHERTTLLSELLIRRGEGVTCTSRRVGPELSRRIYLLLSSRDAQQTLDATT